MDMIDILVDEFILLIPPCLTCDDIGPLVYTAAFWPGNNIIINNDKSYYHYHFV